MNKNKIFGSMLIIAGTTIGAGMLALPMVSAGLGFGTAALVMIVIWGLMTYTALLMIEIHQHAPVDATLHTLAYKHLGRKGQIIASFSMMFLFYALCAAYIAGGGGQVQEKLSGLLNIELPAYAGAIIFTIIIASAVSIGTKSVDILNRGLFFIKMIALIVMLAFLFPYASMENLVQMPVEQGLIIAALPVVFTSFGFHGSIPSIVKYMGKDTKALRNIMIVGSSLPLIIYLLWQIASQGVLSQDVLMQSHSLNAFIGSLSSFLHNSQLSSAVSIFANLALATSFLGVSLGLFDFIADVTHKEGANVKKIQTGLITFLPPLAFALFYPQGFIMALGYAAFALVVLAIFLPVAMVKVQRKENIQDSYKVAGGSFALNIVLAIGILIIIVQTLQILKLIPSLG
ncbi:MAG: amino acid permease [Campylobacteraceae bacterium]|nr:amino acid permease [Campylobacteraceae bacterium]